MRLTSRIAAETDSICIWDATWDWKLGLAAGTCSLDWLLGLAPRTESWDCQLAFTIDS
jgi:hypothetical protein